MNKYVDSSAIIQVIGNIFNYPNLLEQEDKYFFNEDDFPEDLHKIIFGTMYNLHRLGSKSVSIAAIEDYLKARPKEFGIYKASKGAEYITKVAANTSLSSFDYYYNRMKKMSLLRGYQTVANMDLRWLYDNNNILDVKKKQEQEDWLDNTSLEQIADLIDEKISDVRMKCIDDACNTGEQAGDGLDNLLDELKNNPGFGYPLYGKYVNTIVRGARLKKFYLRSAATGVGKTRSMIADACSIACTEMYDNNLNEWVSTGVAARVLYIATEQALDEIQTMMLAFLSGVNEENILYHEYTEGQEARVAKAARMIKQAPLFFKQLSDFSLKDIENTVKSHIREHEVAYIFLDYLHTSLKILEEITRRSGGIKLREDNILFMISVKLKDICNDYGVFILTATQLNGDYREAKVYDQNLLRGAKAIADKVDVGMIMLQVTPEDAEGVAPICSQGGFDTPEIKISVYKNRRGRWSNVLLWCKADRGCCRIEPMFVTGYDYGLCEIEDIKITATESMEMKNK